MASESIARLRFTVRGKVQGVGFRPAVYRLAKDLGLSGWVQNSLQGVLIELEGLRVYEFEPTLLERLPPQAKIEMVATQSVKPKGSKRLEIKKSSCRGASIARITPDLATCADCLKELLDPSDRRFNYPFLNCTQCGPRFSIMKALPYDREKTTMRNFVMCDECEYEFSDPEDRRFHAQPNACPCCGPRLDGDVTQAVQVLREGKILGLKGLTGFHLMVDPFQAHAVKLLRQRKLRPRKSLALMCPSLEWVEKHCYLNETERRALCGIEAPIVLLRPRKRSAVVDRLTPDSPHLGVMLPYTPLHHLLLAEIGMPLVATSANLRDDPIPTEEVPPGLADFVLGHNRPIQRALDDSIVWVVEGGVQVLRLARGFAPLHFSVRGPDELLALGAQQKTAVALVNSGTLTLGPHQGDLETVGAVTRFQSDTLDLCGLLGFEPSRWVYDHHPEYTSTSWAESQANGLRVWHHHAHLAACLLDNDIQEDVLGVIWDGSGLGPDGTIWGGEWLIGNRREYRRVYRWTPFPLYGGDRAVKEPLRIALALLQSLERDYQLPLGARERENLLRLDSPLTSSTGRLFDGVSALLGLCERAEYEGQGALALEKIAQSDCDESYSGEDWPQALSALLDDLEYGTAPETISARFHNWLANVILLVAQREGVPVVALSGGCFQNRILVKKAVSGLRRHGFKVLLHKVVPPNDGGLAAGQAVVACA